MKKILYSILEEWLPTKWSRVIAASSLSLGIALWTLPQIPISVIELLPEKKELLIRIMATTTILCLGLLFVLHLVVRYYKALLSPLKSKNLDDLLIHVLSCVAKYHSQQIPATPSKIAQDVGIDPEVLLAHMWRYHNDQLVSFYSGGQKPDINTGFFLSPKAWELIRVVKT